MKKCLILLVSLLITLSAFGDNADWSKPNTSTLYTNRDSEIKAIVKSAAMMSYASDTNLPAGVIRYNGTTYTFQRWNGAAWTDLGIFPNGSILGQYLVDGTVGVTKIGDNSITTDKIIDGQVQTPDILNQNVTNAKIADGTITAVKFANAHATGTTSGIPLPAACSGLSAASANTSDYNVLGKMFFFRARYTFSYTAGTCNQGFILAPAYIGFTFDTSQLGSASCLYYNGSTFTQVANSLDGSGGITIKQAMSNGSSQYYECQGFLFLS